MCTFYKYYAGEAIAPMLTIFIGGNHEASNYLQVLLFFWVVPSVSDPYSFDADPDPAFCA
jgi:lariat debranching enzyme